MGPVLSSTMRLFSRLKLYSPDVAHSVCGRRQLQHLKSLQYFTFDRGTVSYCNLNIMSLLSSGYDLRVV